MQTAFVPKHRRKVPPSLKKNRDFRGDGGLSSQNRISARNCRTDNFFIGRQFLGRENAPARKANPSFSRRYLDPKYSRWMSADPAVGDYMSQTEKGEGGIYNLANLNVYHYGGNNPMRYTDPTGLYDEENGYDDNEIDAFKNMSVKEQMAFLKSEVGSVKAGTDAAGAKSKHIREQLKDDMKLKGLFYGPKGIGDEKFMNEDLRGFLNLNGHGKNEYSLDDMDENAGWHRFLPPGDSEHQHNQNGGRNVKYVNDDGREAIFDAKNNYIADGIDGPTFNYGFVGNLNPICTTLGSSHGQFDMKPFFRQNGGKVPWYWGNRSVGSNYGFNSM